MLHIIMQAQIAREAGEFEIENVLNKINDKLIRRHPHVFADGPATDANGVKMNWERIKFEEKKKSRQSAIDGIPRAMPALIVAQRMQEKAASVGFDWPDVEPAINKLEEEVAEFKEAFLQKDVEENICTLLGHPTSCPHGKLIPEGDCCKDYKRTYCSSFGLWNGKRKRRKSSCLRPGWRNF